LVQIKRAGLVEKHFASISEDPFDQFVHGVIEGRGTTTAVLQKAISLRGKIGFIFKTTLHQESLATLLKSSAPHLIDVLRAFRNGGYRGEPEKGMTW
jgi:hypothetical protein